MSKIKNKFITLLFILLLTPGVIYAQGSTANACDDNIENISELLGLFACIIRSALIPLLITLSIVIFIIGIIKYIAKADEEKEREEGRKFMLYGIIALFVMVSIWGLVGIIQGTFGLGTNILIPQLQGL